MKHFERARRIIKNEGGWNIDNLEYRFRNAGIRVLGTGAYGIVMPYDNHSVVKFFQADDEGYKAFLDIALAYRSDYLPRIFWQRQISKYCLAICMEKLTQLAPQGLFSKPRDYALFCRMMERGGVEGDEEMVELSDLLYNHSQGLNNLGLDTSLDLHMGNAMRRDGQLVITDPFCT